VCRSSRASRRARVLSCAERPARVHARALRRACCAQLALNLPPNLSRLKLSRAIGFDDAALHCLAYQASCLGGLSALDVGSPGITDAAIPALEALASFGLHALTLWHSKVSREGVERLMRTTGMSLDQSMASSDGTYLLRRGEVAG
jgi:hypothetical protein